MLTPLLLHILGPDQINPSHIACKITDTISQYSGQTLFWEGTSDFHYKPKLYMKGLRTVYAILVSPGQLT